MAYLLNAGEPVRMTIGVEEPGDTENPQNFPQEDVNGALLRGLLRRKITAYYLVVGVRGVVERGRADGVGAEGAGAATPEEALYAVMMAWEISVPG